MRAREIPVLSALRAWQSFPYKSILRAEARPGRRVNDAGRMRLGKCVGDLNAIPHRFIDSQSLLLNYLVQGFPRYVLHRDELEAVGFADVVDVNDVRMV